jgi:Uma2 family endonuclease
MSLPAVSALGPLPFELIVSDGKPLEDSLHLVQMSLLTHLIGRAMAEQGRTRFFTAANTFVYYSVEQAREVFREVTQNLPERAFRGPDIYFVDDVDPRDRSHWVAWEEDGRLPDVIFELLSRSTKQKDRTKKKELYAQDFGTAEYYLYDWKRRTLEGNRLAPGGGVYRPMTPDAQGRFWSEQLGAFVGLWHGVWDRHEYTWIRLFHADGSLVLTKAEAEEQRAETAEQRAEAERRRAEAAEAELARLRALLDRAPES